MEIRFRQHATLNAALGFLTRMGTLASKKFLVEIYLIRCLKVIWHSTSQHNLLSQ